MTITTPAANRRLVVFDEPVVVAVCDGDTLGADDTALVDQVTETGDVAVEGIAEEDCEVNGIAIGLISTSCPNFQTAH